MYEDSLRKVMSGVETTLAALQEDDMPLGCRDTQLAKEGRRLEEKNDIPSTVYTNASRYDSIAAQYVLAYAPVRTEEYGADCGAVMALGAK